MKRTYLLIFIFIILVVIAAYLIFTGRQGIYRGLDNEFAIRDTANIRLIEIRSSDHIIILEKLEDGWMINRQFPASTGRVKGLLSLISRLKVNSIVPASIKNEIISKLENEGKRLMILTHRRHPYITFIYHDSVYTNATYMMAEDSDHAFRMEIPGFQNRDLASLFVDEKNYWRDHTLFQLRSDQIISVSLYDLKKPENSFYLINNGPGDYQLFTNPDSTEIPDPDHEAIEQYFGYFMKVSFEQFLSATDYDSNFSIRDEYIDKIITVHGSHFNDTEVKTFIRYFQDRKGISVKDPNLLYAVINNTDTILIKYIELDPVIKDIGYFLDQ